MKKLLWLVPLLFGHAQAADQYYQWKYGVAFTFPICTYLQSDANTFAVTPAWAAGDAQIAKGTGSYSNTTNPPVDRGTCSTLTLTATEMQTDYATIVFQDPDNLWSDWSVIIETRGAGGRHDDVGWLSYCEDQGTITCQGAMSVMLSALAGECDYSPGGSTFTCTDAEGNETRLVIEYGADQGDRTDSTLTPMTP